jgi:hypothetical protein
MPLSTRKHLRLLREQQIQALKKSSAQRKTHKRLHQHQQVGGQVDTETPDSVPLPEATPDPAPEATPDPAPVPSPPQQEEAGTLGGLMDTITDTATGALESVQSVLPTTTTEEPKEEPKEETEEEPKEEPKEEPQKSPSLKTIEKPPVSSADLTRIQYLKKYGSAEVITDDSLIEVFAETIDSPLCPIEIANIPDKEKPILRIKEDWSDPIPEGSILGIVVKMYSNLFKGMTSTPLYRDILKHINHCDGPSVSLDETANVSFVGRMANLKVEEGVAIEHHIVVLYSLKELQAGDRVIVYCQMMPNLNSLDTETNEQLNTIQSSIDEQFNDDEADEAETIVDIEPEEPEEGISSGLSQEQQQDGDIEEILSTLPEESEES